jgi:DNA-binding NarL/FixJ family response regulator
VSAHTFLPPVRDRVDGGPSGEGSVRRLRVVLVDDYLPIRQLIAELLPHAFCTVVGEAADGQAALDLLPAADCDLVVMDVNMPVMSGVEATRVITRRYPAVKVVAYTSADAIGARQMIDAGATAYFDKKAPLSGLIDFIIAEARRRHH